MVTDTEGLVLRQVRTVGGRRMILLFSKQFGKISVGSSLTEGGKNKTALAIRPFTRGRYALYKGRESYNLNSAQALESFYGIGEDVDKYMAASYVLELTEKLLPEELPQPRLYSLLLEFLEVLQRRSKECGTLVMAYMVKALAVLGNMPELSRCAGCNAPLEEQKGGKRYFSVAEGGMICEKCAKSLGQNGNSALIYAVNFDIVEILKYFQKNSLTAFSHLVLEEKKLAALQRIMRRYFAYHLDVGELKSEAFLGENMLQ